MLPPTDAQGRFLPQLRTASIFSRYFAKAADLTLAGTVIVGLTIAGVPYPWAALSGSAWFLLSDWAGSPGKWLLQIRAVTLGGKPGIEIKVKEKAKQRGKPGDNGFWDKYDLEERERVAKDGMFTVTYFTHDGNRMYSIRISQKRAFPSDDVLKIIAESFSFL